MDYEKLIEQVRDASKEDVKKMIFETDRDITKRIKSLKLDSDSTKELLTIVKDMTFLSLLLANSLK